MGARGNLDAVLPYAISTTTSQGGRLQDTNA